MAFTYRTIKGSELTWAELDENFRLVDQYHDDTLAASNTAVAAANFKGNWNSLVGSLNIPASVRHNGQFWELLENIPDVTAEEPTISSTKWARLNNMVGPTSAVDGHAVVFDGTTGQLIKSLGAPPLKSTGDSMKGPLTFNYTGARLYANLSAVTISTRFLFQNSVVNGISFVGVIPNGTSTSSSFQAYGSSDPNNTHLIQVAALTSSVTISSDKTGTGTFRSMEFYTGGVVRLTIANTGGITATSPISVPAGATGTNVPRAQEVRALSYLTSSDITGTTGTVANGEHKRIVNVAATVVTAPGSVCQGKRFRVSVMNNLKTNSINWNGLKHEGLSDATLILDIINASTEWEYISATYGWKRLSI